MVLLVLKNSLGLGGCWGIRENVYVYRILIRSFSFIARCNDSPTRTLPGWFLNQLRLSLISRPIESVINTASSSLLLPLIHAWFLLSGNNWASSATVVASTSILYPCLRVRSCSSLSSNSARGCPCKPICLRWLWLVDAVVSSWGLPSVGILSQTTSDTIVRCISLILIEWSSWCCLLLWSTTWVAAVGTSPTGCCRSSSNWCCNSSL